MKENHQISLLVHCYLIKEKKQKQKVREKKKSCAYVLAFQVRIQQCRHQILPPARLPQMPLHHRI